MCTNCPTCAQHTQQHPLEPLQPYPVPKLPWQLVLQYLFGLNGQGYHVIVDHYSDYYEVDHLLTTQSTAVIQAPKPHRIGRLVDTITTASCGTLPVFTSLSKEPPSSPARPESLSVTRSGRIVRRPAHYSK